MTPGGDVVYFDGVCNLCSNAVQWIIERDKNNVFKFSSLQSEHAAKSLDHKTVTQLKSIVVKTSGGKVYKKSKAVFYILKSVNYTMLYTKIGAIGFVFTNTYCSDFIYNMVAYNRYRLFGKKSSCWLPTDELKTKFLD